MKIMRCDSAISQWPAPARLRRMGPELSCKRSCRNLSLPNLSLQGELSMWTKPEFTEMRFGFEVTMYIYNR